jgi:hypothetical protein
MAAISIACFSPCSLSFCVFSAKVERSLFLCSDSCSCLQSLLSFGSGEGGVSSSSGLAAGFVSSLFRVRWESFITMSVCSSAVSTLPWASLSVGCRKSSSFECKMSQSSSNYCLCQSFLLIRRWIDSDSLYGMVSGFRLYFLRGISLFSVRLFVSSVPVVLLLVFVVRGVTFGVLLVCFVCFVLCLVISVIC